LLEFHFAEWRGREGRPRAERMATERGEENDIHDIQARNGEPQIWAHTFQNFQVASHISIVISFTSSSLLYLCILLLRAVTETR
jgi:hypothetical protein